MRRVFICRPFSNDPEGSQTHVAAIARQVAKEGHLPVPPQILLPRFIDEITERDLALKLCLELVALSNEVRVYGQPSAGMRVEIAEAYRLGIPVLDGEMGITLPKREPPR
jgi:hypothetical protein